MFSKKSSFLIPPVIVVNFSHQDNSDVVKEVKFPNPSGNLVKLEYSGKCNVVKDVKFLIPPVLSSSLDT